MHPPTYEMAWGKLPTSPPSEADCIIRTRLGLLLDGRDHWWPPNEQSAATEIANALTSVALPFLSGFEDLASIERWLDESKANRYPPEALYLAAVKHERGRKAEARKVIEQLLQRTTSGQWRERICSFAATFS